MPDYYNNWDLPITIYEDNKSDIMFADHPGDHRTTKHVDTKVNFARQAQTNDLIKLLYVPTAEQLADGMTKALPSSLFLCNYLNETRLFEDKIVFSNKYFGNSSLIYACVKALIGKQA